MRIDIGANELFPNLQNDSRRSSDSQELLHRGENIKGKIIDVNQSIVLIQTSTGKEFVANTTYPLENFIGDELSFQIMLGPDGEVILRPEISEEELNLLNNIKDEDLLIQMNKQPTAENKMILKQMVKMGIPVHEENFTDIKNNLTALSVLKNDATLSQQLIGEKMLVSSLTELVKQLDTQVTTTSLFNQPVNLKGHPAEIIFSKSLENPLENILTLTKLNKPVTTENLKALEGLIHALSQKNSDNDIVGMKGLATLADSFHQNKQSGEQVNQSFYSKNTFNELTFSADNPSFASFQDNQTLSNQLIKDLSQIIKNLSDKIPLASSIIDESTQHLDQIPEQTRPLIKEMLFEVQSELIKNMDPSKSTTANDVKLNIEKVQEDLKLLLKELPEESALHKAIEHDVFPKTELLRDLSKQFQYHVIPFQMKEYENVAEYYIKKNKRINNDKEDISVAFSLDTHNIGHVNAYLVYHDSDRLSIQITNESNDMTQKLQDHLPILKTRLEALGFKNLNIKIKQEKINDQSMMQTVLNENPNRKSFESWV